MTPHFLLSQGYYTLNFSKNLMLRALKVGKEGHKGGRAHGCAIIPVSVFSTKAINQCVN